MQSDEVLKIIEDSISKLKVFYDDAKSNLHNISRNETYIQQGRTLLNKINIEKLFEDEHVRDSQSDLLNYENEIQELNYEMSKVANLVRLLKGDISIEIFNKYEIEIKTKYDLS